MDSRLRCNFHLGCCLSRSLIYRPLCFYREGCCSYSCLVCIQTPKWILYVGKPDQRYKCKLQFYTTMKIVITLPLIAMLNQAEIDILLQYIKNIQSFNKLSIGGILGVFHFVSLLLKNVLSNKWLTLLKCSGRRCKS